CTCSENKCPDNGEVPDCDPEHKTLICHVPPGNPDNAHSICVDNHAVDAHLEHHDGDHLGACTQECGTDNSASAAQQSTGKQSGDSASIPSGSGAGAGCSLLTAPLEGADFSGIAFIGTVIVGLYGARRRRK